MLWPPQADFAGNRPDAFGQFWHGFDQSLASSASTRGVRLGAIRMAEGRPLGNLLRHRRSSLGVGRHLVPHAGFVCGEAGVGFPGTPKSATPRTTAACEWHRVSVKLRALGGNGEADFRAALPPQFDLSIELLRELSRAGARIDLNAGGRPTPGKLRHRENKRTSAAGTTVGSEGVSPKGLKLPDGRRRKKPRGGGMARSASECYPGGTPFRPSPVK